MATINEIKVAPPANGRPDMTEGDGAIVVQVIDVGGNGRPSSALFMPVKKVGDRGQLVISGNPKGQPYTQDELFGQAGVVISRLPEGTSSIPPYQFRIQKDKWPNTGDFVLLLLVYPQTGGIGQLHSNLFSFELSRTAAWPSLLDMVKLDLPKVGELAAITAKLNERITVSSWSALDNGLMPKG